LTIYYRNEMSGFFDGASATRHDINISFGIINILKNCIFLFCNKIVYIIKDIE